MRMTAILALFCFVTPAAAEDKKEKPKENKLSGSWIRESNGFTMKFSFLKGNMMKASIGNGSDGCNLEAKYSIAKDGTVKCELTKYEKMGNFIDKEKGYKFSFKLEIKGEVAKMSAIVGDDIDDQGKMVMEGDHKKLKDD
jgi:hypothetical protein